MRCVCVVPSRSLDDGHSSCMVCRYDRKGRGGDERERELDTCYRGTERRQKIQFEF
jgi:hypothetical protein